MSAQKSATLCYSSVYQEAIREADRHKWIESQKRGYDAGRDAITEWYRHHWNGYCRSKRLEHIRGAQRWAEFNDEGFGWLRELIESHDLLIDRIMDRYYAGYENLTLIQWAYDWGLPIDRVLQILERLDVNRSRLDPSEKIV